MQKVPCLAIASVPLVIMGGLNLEICKKFVDTIFFLHLWGDKPLLGELKLYGGVIFISTLSLFHFLKNSQHPEK